LSKRLFLNPEKETITITDSIAEVIEIKVIETEEWIEIIISAEIDVIEIITTTTTTEVEIAAALEIIEIEEVVMVEVTLVPKVTDIMIKLSTIEKTIDPIEKFT
jgi:hypothetical protein